MKPLNPKDMKRTRPSNNPYEVWTDGQFTYKVLKKYQNDDNKPYARAFLATSSPFTWGSEELGDGYIADYQSRCQLIEVNP